MEIRIPILQDFTLSIANAPARDGKYPTACLQKGLILQGPDRDLAEEAVGFGLPVLKRGLKAFFPGEVSLESTRRDETWKIMAGYTINLEEKIALPGNAILERKSVYAVKNFLAAVLRQFPPTRQVMTALSTGLRRRFGWKTTYGSAELSTRVQMTYRIDDRTGVIDIQAEADGLDQDGVTELIIMNEQGAHIFDGYRDSSGTQLTGDQIGLWDEVTAGEASFTSSSHRVAFSLAQVPGAHLFRGREEVDSRLAWSGFGYTIPPATRRFNCNVKVEKLT